MIMKRVLTICVALLLVMVVAAVPVATAVEAPTCWSATEKNEGWYSGGLQWTYLHTVSWCGDGSSVVSVDEPVVWVDLRDARCTWQGPTEAWSDRPGGSSAETFSVGEVVCAADDATTRGMNPWVVLTVHANGEYDTKMGIA
jgi:hypothetical protein